MILLMAGSSEAREVLPLLLKEVDRVLVTTATDYPYPLMPAEGQGRVSVRQGRLDKDQMVELIRLEGIHCLVDATHPFAAEASATAIQACKQTEVPYIRFQRKAFPLPHSELIHQVKDQREAAHLACRLGQTIFLTTGSKDLEVFCEHAKEVGRRLLVRVLPSPESIQKCLQAGVHPDSIIAMKGPFSARLNTALWSDLSVDTVVTKESGEEGGLPEKIKAALELSINLVVVKRPTLHYPVYFEEPEALRCYLRQEGIV